MYTNVRSLFTGSKKEELKILMQNHDVDILGLTKTWGRSDIVDSKLDFPGFKLYRTDRSAVNNKKVAELLLSVECDDLTSYQCESVWCKIYVNQVDYFIAVVCYRSPDVDENEKQQLFDCIKTAKNLNTPLSIMGDFNYPGIEWEQLRAGDAAVTKFVKLIMDCYLEQHVHSSTRGNNILDLVLTSELEPKGEVIAAS